jgi:anaphase-promoting complex subunit 3
VANEDYEKAKQLF